MNNPKSAARAKTLAKPALWEKPQNNFKTEFSRLGALARNIFLCFSWYYFP
jgi:hypothetical protein